VKTYCLSENEFRPIFKKIVINGTATMIIIGGIVTYFTLRENGFQHLEILWGVVPLMTIASVIGVLRGARIRKDAWVSYRLDLDESGVVRRQANVPEVRLSRSEVTRIRQFKDGLRIESSNRQSFIVIPRCIEGFEEIRVALSHWQEITDAPGLPRAVYFILLVLWMAVFLSAMCSTTREIIVPTAILSLIILAWSGILILSSRHVDSRIQKTAWFIILPFLALCVKLYLSINH
jgi:hypothetical protein